MLILCRDGEAESIVSVSSLPVSRMEGCLLAPSVAVGIVYKTNVEERLVDKISDAEYEMFNNKLEIKNAPGYQERLTKGLKLQEG